MKDRPKNSLDEREKAFEAKYQLDEAIAFKVNARRAKLLGLWVAERLGITGEDATVYARAAVESDLLVPGHVAMLEKLQNDLRTRGLDGDDADLSREMSRLEAVAREQVVSEVLAAKPETPPKWSAG